MYSLLASVFSGLMSGLVTPLFGYLNKRQDVNLEGFKAASTTDQATFMAWTQYQIQVQQLKIASNQWIGPKILYMMLGSCCITHICAIYLDSTFLFNWHVAKVPAPYDSFEEMVAGSLFVTSLASGPVSAITSWFHRR